MEKVTINNQVVLMRKFVKQGKIRAINKYIKEIRLLQNRKGHDDEASKHKRKAERLISKVAILRKIRPDSVSRKALAKEKDWNVVLQEKNIPLEEQCYAMLANYAPVQNEVEKFHKKSWDLVPKIASLFKTWEEMSKNPMTKQEKKKAKQLRKNMKHIKLDKNNPNATPISMKHKENMIENKNISNIETSLNMEENKESTDLKDKSSDDLNNEHSSPRIQDNLSVTANTKEASVDNKKKIQQSKNIQQNSEKKIVLKAKFQKSKIDLNKTAELSDKEETELSDEKESELSDKEELENNISEQIANSDFEDKEESEASSHEVDSFSENNDTSDEESRESDFDAKEIPEDIKEPSERKGLVKKQPNLKTAQSEVKLQSIQAKLKAIADGGQKVDAKEKQKSNFKSKISSVKKSELNDLKAVTMLNLNEIQDLDEIPIKKAENIPEVINEQKRKKDSFFLGKGGEVQSESDNEDSTNTGQEIDSPAFKKKKFESFDKRSSDGDFFKRRFQDDSRQNKNSGFRENGFQGNKRNSDFQDRKTSFNKREKSGFEFNKDKRSMNNDQFKGKREDRSFGNRESAGKPSFQLKNKKEQFQKVKRNSFSPKKNGSDDKPLHPSWEAKKKLKETAKAKFQGKRIVFGD